MIRKVITWIVIFVIGAYFGKPLIDKILSSFSKKPKTNNVEPSDDIEEDTKEIKEN